VSASVVALRAAAPAWTSAFPHVLAGVEMDRSVACLAGLLDRDFLTEAGWDPVTRVLRLPAQHPLLGRSLCRVDGCAATARGGRYGEGGVCWRCLTRLRGQGLSVAEIADLAPLPPLPARPAGCAVAGCLRMSPVPRSRLCQPHSRRLRRTPGRSIEAFLADPRVRPLPALGPCHVAACIRNAESEHGYCPTHYVRWRTTLTADPDVDERHWRITEGAVAEGGQVSLRGLPPLVVVEVLLGLQQRTRGEAKANDVSLRAVCDALRRQQVASIAACEAEGVPGKPARALLRALAAHVRRALADPGSEQVKDVWDLAVFGHPGRLSFTGIAQPWLRLAAKRWAGEHLPRHRGGGSKVREKISSIGRLSEVLRLRHDHGDLPAALGRPDIENFLNRLAYCESAGEISRDRRVVVCRDVRAVLAGIRALGLTRAGQSAAGLADDFTLGCGDIPAEPEQGEPGRDLAPEVMRVLCDNLDTLQPVEVKTAVQIGIDTGRRPEDILDLPLDCLRQDKDGAAVLVYDNAKAHRLGRRLPISQATAAVIAAQQNLVRERFPHTPVGELKLLPTPRRNPAGRRAITIAMLDQRHREWVAALPTLRTGDDVEVDKTRIVPYAYRHTYAQRHADAGVPIDVLVAAR
jgi:integrase